MLSMAGGTVDYTDLSENVLEAALRRELFEEIGVTVSEDIRYVESKHFVTDSGERVMDIVFMAEYTSVEPTAISADEVESVQWMTLEEIRQYSKTPVWIRESIGNAERIRRND